MRQLYLILFSTFFLLNASVLANNNQLLQRIVQRAYDSESNSLVLIQGGQTIYSNFFGGRDEVRSVQSITKSVCALAIAALLDQGKIYSLDLPMSTWIPEWTFHNQKSKITLRMILSHTSGLPDVDTETTFWSKANSVQAAIETELIAEPGSQYLYSNIGTSLLEAVIAQASSKSVTEFVGKTLFAPLIIQDSRWDTDKVGQELTSGGLYLSTNDLVKIGTLLLNNGFYADQLLSPERIEHLTTRSQPFFAYGLLFWLAPQNEQIFSARGWGGQYITIHPAKNLIAVRTKDVNSITEEKRNYQAFPDFVDLISQWD